MSSICSHSVRGTNCQQCGLYIDAQQGITGIKSKLFQSTEVGDIRRSHKLMLKSSDQTQPRKLSIPPQNILTLIDTLIVRFSFNRQTHALAIYNYSVAVTNKKLTPQRELLFVGSCVLLAAKIADKQRSIPGLSRVARALDAQNCTKQQLTSVQVEVFESLQNDLYFITFVDFIDCYMTNGVVFSNENVKDVGLLEESVQSEVNTFIKSGKFLKYKQWHLALFLIYKVRRLFETPTAWNQHLQRITTVDCQKCVEIVKEVEMVEELALTIKKSVVNIRYDLVPSTEKKFEAESNLRKLLFRGQQVIRTRHSKWRNNSIKSYEKLNISSFKVE